jgi:photosystem II stability/assembly factor-like uncharacterized protein
MLRLFLCCCLSLLPALLAGQEWERVAIPPDPLGIPDYWLEAYFLPANPRYGWIVGHNGHTLRTTDGGRSWQRSDVPWRDTNSANVPIYTGQGHLEGISFADSLVGYCSGPSGIYKSTDGGRTWSDIRNRRLIPDGRTWGCLATSRDTVYVVGGGCGDEQAFYRSTDGGQTWTAVIRTETNSGLSDVIMRSSRGLGYATSSGRIWRTLDGGQTWNVLARTGTTRITTVATSAAMIPESVWQEDLAVAGNTILVPLSGLFCSGGGGEAGGARISTDGGQSWREIQTGVVMYGSFLLDSLRGWAVGDEATLIYTGDGGVTWQNRNCGIPKEVNIDDLWFAGDTLGVAVGGNIGDFTGAVYRYVPPREQGRLASTPPRICPGDSVRITAPADWPYYIWTTGDTTRSITVGKAGKYSARTCSVGSDTVEVSLKPVPDARIVATAMGRACEGDSVFLTARDVQRESVYRWTRDGQAVSDAPVFVAKQSGAYTLTVENASGCRAVSSATVTIFPRPTTTIAAQRPLQFCLADSTVLAAPEGFVRYVWRRVADGQTNSNLSQSRVIAARQSGLYSAELTDANSCVWQSNALEVTAYNFAKQLFIASRLDGAEFRVENTYIGDRMCGQMRLVNRDSIRSVSIPSVFMARNTEFSTPLSQFPLVVPPRSERVLTICFSPQAAVVRRDTIFVADSCGATPVALVGLGVADTLTGQSRCGPEVIVRSVGVGRAAAFNVSQPSPNPASELLYVATDRVLESASSPNVAQSGTPSAVPSETPFCALYTLLGTEVARGTYTVLGTSADVQPSSQAASNSAPNATPNAALKTEQRIREQGEFAVSLRSVPAGNYMLIVRDKQGMTAFPVVVER